MFQAKGDSVLCQIKRDRCVSDQKAHVCVQTVKPTASDQQLHLCVTRNSCVSNQIG